ncbi:hypothetical protein KFR76_05690 [Corynebacterium diphtheriae]|nr:hypothetical protein KFR76_05690 [Corynebacterium diphtheriae]
MMTPYMIFLVLLAFFIWRRASSVTTFLLRFAIASIGSLIPYLVVAFAFTLVSGTFQLHEDGEKWREQQVAETGVDPCVHPEDESPDVLPRISEKFIAEQNSLTWEEKQQKQKEAYDLWYKCQTGR